jgi:hypothetical protein
MYNQQRRRQSWPIYPKIAINAAEPLRAPLSWEPLNTAFPCPDSSLHTLFRIVPANKAST